ncbi:MAG: rRNA maturation RNase YbeY [Chloroflexota bacterium]
MQYDISIQIQPSFEEFINQANLIAVAQQTLKHQHVDRGTLTIVLTEDAAVREQNQLHRGIDAPTDVLSFPNHGSINLVDPPGSADDQLILPPELMEEEAEYLGDIMIAVPFTTRQADKAHRSLTDELNLLVAHGVLHLLGYDHATEEEEATMWRIQDEILQSLPPGTEINHDKLTGRSLGFLAGRWYSFRMAVNGAWHTLRTQPNAWIELAAVAVITAGGLFFRITPVEWALLALSASLVIALEAINTAIEATVDLVTTDYHPLAKIAKDSAAGALVFSVLGTLCVAAAVFGPRLWRLFQSLG